MEQFKKIPLGQAKDISNQRFGTLVALYRTENLKSGGAKWVCQCDCGKLTAILANGLTQGKITSCGCKNREKARIRMQQYNEKQRTIQVGDKFGLLTVVEYEGLRKQKSRNKNESWYICQCACGSELKSIRGNDLKTGAIISCGCIKSAGETYIKNLLKENNVTYKQEYSFHDLVNPKTNHCLRFDFAIFEENKLLYLIEFDGRQHYTGPDTKSWNHSDDTLETIQYRDNLKNEYCKKNNITLKRVPYFDLYKLQYEDLIGEKYIIN